MSPGVSLGQIGAWRSGHLGEQLRLSLKSPSLDMLTFTWQNMICRCGSLFILFLAVWGRAGYQVRFHDRARQAIMFHVTVTQLEHAQLGSLSRTQRVWPLSSLPSEVTGRQLYIGPPPPIHQKSKTLYETASVRQQQQLPPPPLLIVPRPNARRCMMTMIRYAAAEPQCWQ